MAEKKELEDVLKELEKIGDIIGSAIVRRDGLLIASGLPSEVNARAVAAMAAAIVGTSETSTKELEIGEFQQVVVNASEGQYVAIGAGEEAILIALLRKNANIGLILLEMEKAAKKIEKLV
jgi:predicted regulator of Ras-like GTPase activity (Roadblock/LC7/MglB family)